MLASTRRSCEGCSCSLAAHGASRPLPRGHRGCQGEAPAKARLSLHPGSAGSSSSSGSTTSCNPSLSFPTMTTPPTTCPPHRRCPSGPFRGVLPRFAPNTDGYYHSRVRIPRYARCIRAAKLLLPLLFLLLLLAAIAIEAAAAAATRVPRSPHRGSRVVGSPFYLSLGANSRLRAHTAPQGKDEP